MCVVSVWVGGDWGRGGGRGLGVWGWEGTGVDEEGDWVRVSESTRLTHM